MVGRTSGHPHQDPTDVDRLTFATEAFSVSLLSYGAALEAVEVPNQTGDVANVCLSLGPIKERETNPYMGATIGRFANRLGGSTVDIDGRAWPLRANEGPNQLHGGPYGFSHYVWEVQDVGVNSVRFGHVSPAGDMGFPGTLTTTATYTITPNTIAIDMAATTDAPTVVSMTNHAYWNLGGPAHINTDDHRVTVEAETWLPVGPDLVPISGPTPVAGTPFDLRAGVVLGDLVGADGMPSGIDHCLIVDGSGFRRHALIEHSASGRTLEVWSDHPAAQVYGGGALSTRSAAGRSVSARAGMCIEPEHLPRAAESAWPPPILRPGETYRHQMEFRFGLGQKTHPNFDT